MIAEALSAALPPERRTKGTGGSQKTSPDRGRPSRIGRPRDPALRRVRPRYRGQDGFARGLAAFHKGPLGRPTRCPAHAGLRRDGDASHCRSRGTPHTARRRRSRPRQKRLGTFDSHSTATPETPVRLDDTNIRSRKSRKLLRTTAEFRPHRSGLLLGSTARSDRAFESEPENAAAAPRFRAEGRATTNAVSKGLLFPIVLRLIEPLDPLSWKRRILRLEQPRRAFRFLREGMPIPTSSLPPERQGRPAEDSVPRTA